MRMLTYQAPACSTDLLTTCCCFIDWRGFSSVTEGMDDTNPWADCTYTSHTGRGFPGDCGPAGDTKMRWISKDSCDAMSSPDTAMYVLDAACFVYTCRRLIDLSLSLSLSL